MIQVSFDHIGQISSKLQELLSSLSIFDEVRIGIPESTVQFKNAVATVYTTGGRFDQTMGQYNIPIEVESVIFAVYRGTKPATYSKAIEDLVTILKKFNTEEEWYTVKGTTRMTKVDSFQHIPRVVGKGFYTTIVYNLKHDVREPY